MVKIDPEQIKYLIVTKPKSYTHDTINEELAELIQAHTKLTRFDANGGNRHDRDKLILNLYEEIVDVYISLKILQQMYNLNPDAIQISIDKKMKQNIQRAKATTEAKIDSELQTEEAITHKLIEIFGSLFIEYLASGEYDR